MANKKAPIPKIDLSKYANEERIPGNIISIIKNALVIFEGNTKKVANHYNFPVEKVIAIFTENYLQLTQTIQSQTKSKELDAGINSAISLITDHVQALQSQKTNNLMTKGAIADVTRMTDRMISLKDQFNKSYDTLVNKMSEQALKLRAIEVQEQGKIEDTAEYLENQNTVANMLSNYLENKKEKKIILVNVKTYETKTFTSVREAEEFLGPSCINHLRDIAARKSPYKEEWLVNIEG